MFDPQTGRPIWETHELVLAHEPGEMIAFLNSTRDPSLWCEVVGGLNYDNPDALGVVKWICEQDDCQNAIAAYALQMLDIAYYCGSDEASSWNEESFEIVSMIVARANRAQFPASGLSDPADFDRASLLEECRQAEARVRNAGKVPVVTAPAAILAVKPTGPEPSTLYQVIEALIFKWVRQ